ncbi:D-alanyl-D-alanine carboxypeptidase [Streptomyces sp. NPDC051997]|uniref:D-alanyl-D-alanine carboxypeptidase n=1 Tax=Streptomyces sp. NPDC051997 TaxID=3155611 RepID=UPI00342128E2
MAMARERAATVRVDQATAVFSTKALKGEAARTADAPLAAEPERASEPAEGDGASGGKNAEGDTRLRAAVAAWVAGTDEPAPSDSGSDSGSGSGSDSGSASGESETDGDAEGEAGSDTGSGSDAGSEAGDGAADETETETDADAGDADRSDAVTDGAEPDDAVTEPADATGASGASATAEDAPEASDTARVASGTDGTAAESAAGPGSDRDIDIDTDATAGTDEDDENLEEDSEPGRKPEAASAATPADDEDDEDDEEDRPASASTSTSTSASGDEPEDAAPEDRPEAAPKGRTEGTGDSSADSADEPSDTPADEPSDAKPAEPSDAVTDETPDTDADETPDTEADEDSAPGRPVDQPTAVFKTTRRPAVDQPTTMLKLGGATRKPADAKPATGPTDAPADKATDKSAADSSGDGKGTEEPGAKPAGTPVRTSKFVPLNRLDDFPPARSKPTTEPAAKPEPAPAEPKGTAAPAPERTAAPKPAPKPVDRPAAATAAFPRVGPERTTQLPLPPKPPLDLLAELTNTPPPPQTPVRTLVRRVKIWTPLLLLLVVIFAVAQAFRPLPAPALALSADSTYTFGGGTLDLPWPGQGQSAIEVDGVGSLGTDGKQTPSPTASVAKIMTAYVILQEHPLKGNEDGEKITVDQQAEDESKLPDESTAAMSKGQQFTERQMLQMLMIPSGNNVARLLARWDSDSKTFVTKMNAAAKDLGMTNTTYTDPSGLQKTTVSTATDQIKLAKEVMKNDVFRSIVGMASAKIPGLANPIYNNNDLLVQQVGVIGLKTGSSTPAGGNLVWAATKVVDGKTQTIYGAVMNQNAGTGKVWDSLHLALVNSQKLIDKVQKSLVTATVVKKGQVVGYVDDQLGGRTPVVATKNMTAIGWPGLKTRLSIGEGKSAVPHTGKAGTVVGELRVGDGSSEAVRIPVALRSDLAEPGFGAKLTRVG